VFIKQAISNVRTKYNIEHLSEGHATAMKNDIMSNLNLTDKYESAVLPLHRDTFSELYPCLTLLCKAST
jgi:hypothetical protein